MVSSNSEAQNKIKNKLQSNNVNATLEKEHSKLNNQVKNSNKMSNHKIEFNYLVLETCENNAYKLKLF